MPLPPGESGGRGILSLRRPTSPQASKYGQHSRQKCPDSDRNTKCQRDSYGNRHHAGDESELSGQVPPDSVCGRTDGVAVDGSPVRT